MKLFVAVVLVGIASAGRLDSNNYLPPQSKSASSALNRQNIYPSGPVTASASTPPGIVRLNNENKGDGSYKFDFETENRISHQEIGEVKNAGTDRQTNVIQGSYSYTGPDGVLYTVNYIADENGFRASGDHIPTSAPVPAEIVEALQQNAADEAAGVVDDGQYRPHLHEETPARPTLKAGYKY